MKIFNRFVKIDITIKMELDIAYNTTNMIDQDVQLSYICVVTGYVFVGGMALIIAEDYGFPVLGAIFSLGV